MGELRKIGRPRKVIDLAAVEELAAVGASKSAVAARLGFHREAFDNRADLREAFERGAAALEIELAARLLEKARSGDTIAVLFSLKGRFGWRDSGPSPETAPAPQSVVIHLPSNERDFLPGLLEKG